AQPDPRHRPGELPHAADGGRRGGRITSKHRAGVDMSEVVFVLGAGASKDAGAPLMAEFLDVADDLRKHSKIGEAATSDFALVFKALGSLQQAHSKAYLDLNNIESVFAAFEMAKLLGTLGALSQEELNQLPGAMRTLIVTTLEQSIEFGVGDPEAQDTRRAVRPAGCYR